MFDFVLEAVLNHWQHVTIRCFNVTRCGIKPGRVRMILSVVLQKKGTAKSKRL